MRDLAADASMQPDQIDVAIMRAGTSKGLFLRLEDVPEDRGERCALLERLLGTDSAQIDGLGGGHLLTSKVGLVSSSAEDGVDVDYRFVQIVPGRSVNDAVSCGNLLTAVGPFAIENGIVAATDPETVVTVRDVNNGSLARLLIQTPGGKVRYDGDASLPGTPGTAAPIRVTYTDLISDPGELFPTGNVVDSIAGAEFSYIKAAVPLLIFHGSDFDVDFSEKSIREMNKRERISRILNLRDEIVAGRDGQSDRKSPSPKVVLVGEPCEGGTLALRYFTPHTPHLSLAVTGALTLAIACGLEGTVAAQHAKLSERDGELVKFGFEHLAGTMSLDVSYQDRSGVNYPQSVSLLRTARLLMRGAAFLPCYETTHHLSG